MLFRSFKLFPDEIKQRNIVAQKYDDALKQKYQIPKIASYNNKSAYAQYTIKLENRSEIQEKLKFQNIPTVVYYPVPLPFQTVFKQYQYQPEDFPISAQLSKQVLSLPMSPYLKEIEQQQVIAALLEI